MGYVDIDGLYGPVEEEIEVAPLFNSQDTPENRSWAGAIPPKQGLYDPQLEKDACGVGFAAYVVTHQQEAEKKADEVLQTYQGESQPQNYQRW